MKNVFLRIHQMLCLLALACTLSPAAANSDRLIKIVVPFPAGGATDSIARTIAAEVTDKASIRMIVENRPGADGMIATEQVLQRSDAASSILMVNPFYTNAIASGALPADKAARFKPLIQLIEMDIVLIASKRSAIDNLRDIYSNSRTKPLVCAGAGGQFTLFCDQLARELPQIITSVPYRGEAQAIQDLLGGHVDFMPITRISAAQHLRSDSVTLVANLSSPPTGAQVRDLPQALKQPVKSFMGFVVTDDMPAETARILNQEVNKALLMTAFQSKAASMGVRVIGGSDESFERFLRSVLTTQVGPKR